MRQIPNSSQKKLFPVYLITFLDQVAITLCFPVLTFICFDQQSALFAKGVSHAVRSYWFGILSAIPHLVPIVAAPLLGLLSDLFGRKKLLMLGASGIVFYGFFSSMSILVGSLSLLIVGYLINGVCVRTEPIALAVVSDCSEKEQKFVNIGHLQFYIAMGATLGPLIGGYLIHGFYFKSLNFSLPYFSSVFVGFLTLIATFLIFDETNCHRKMEKQSLKDLLPELLNKELLLMIMVLLFTQMAWRIYYQFIPPVLKLAANYSGTTIGFFMGSIAVWLALASSLGIKMLNRFFNKNQILWCCLIFMTIGLVMVLSLFYLHNGFSKEMIIWCSALPMAAGDVIIYSMISAALLNRVSQQHHGKMMGINFIVVSVTWSLTGLVGSLLFAVNVKLPFVLAFFSLFCAYLTGTRVED